MQFLISLVLIVVSANVVSPAAAQMRAELVAGGKLVIGSCQQCVLRQPIVDVTVRRGLAAPFV